MTRYLTIFVLLVAVNFAVAEPESVPGSSALPTWQKRRLALDRICRGLSAMGRDDPIRAARAFQEAAALDTANPHPRFLRALTRLRLEQPLEALGEFEALEKSLERVPRAVLLAKTHCLRALERCDEADEIDVVARKVDVESAEDHLWMGWVFLRPTVEILEGSRGEMIAAIKATPGQNPFLPRLTLSCVYRRLGRIEAALEQASIAARRPQAGAASLIHLAGLHRLLGQPAEESRVLERAHLIAPNCPETARLLAARWIARGDLRKALKILGVACTTPSARVFWLRAHVERRFGNSEESFADLVRCLGLDATAGLPGGVDPADRRLLPDAWEKIEKATRAIEAKKSGAVADLYYRMRGRAALVVGRHTEALEDLERAVLLSPGHAELMRPLILEAMAHADPKRALVVIGERIDKVLGDEEIVLGRLRLRAVMVQGTWTDVADVAADLRGRMENREHDLELQGVEPGAWSRVDLARGMALTRLLEARGRIANGNGAVASDLIDDVVDDGPFDIRAEALSVRAWLLVGEDEEKARDLLETVGRLHDPTLLFSRGRGHPLNGWTARFAAATWRRLGDEKAANTWFTRAIDEALPAWAEEIIEPD